MEIIENNLSFERMNIRKKTERVILHHADSSSCTIGQIHSWHKSRGWSGVGYHFFIRKDGKIYRGRPENTVGAHAKNSNFDSIGVCFEGKYESEEMEKCQIESGQKLIKYLKDKYKISILQIHKDVNKTLCPGKNFPFDIFKVIPFEDVTIQNTKLEEEEINKIKIKQIKKINIVLVKNTQVGIWQNKMNKVYNTKLIIDNCFGNDCKAKANKNCIVKGKVNDMVKWLQNKLNNKGVDSGKVDGIFGQKTLNAVLKFQKIKKLKIDGMVGAKTTVELLK